MGTTATSSTNFLGFFTDMNMLKFVYSSDYKYAADLRMDPIYTGLNAHAEGSIVPVANTNLAWTVTATTASVGFGSSWRSSPFFTYSNTNAVVAVSTIFATVHVFHPYDL